MKQPNEHIKRPQGSVDGIMPAPSRGQAPTRSFVGQKNLLGTSAKNHGRPVSRPLLGDFKKTDGFVPNSRPHLGTTAISTTETAAVPTVESSEPPRNLDRNPLRRPDGSIDLSLPDDNNGKKKRRRFRFRFGKPTKKTVLLSGVMLFVVAGAILGKGWYDIAQVFKGGGNSAILAGDTSQLKGEGDGRINVLLLGKGGDGHTAPDLTDTILIASIDPINKKASLLSIPRDLWVAPEGGGFTKINAVYANAKNRVLNGAQIDNQADEAEKAGLAAIENEVSKDMGIPIHYHVMVDFEGFKDAVDNVGGVDIDVKSENTVYETLWDPTVSQHYVLNVQEGNQHFDGRKALFYSRSRQTSRRGDFDRTERQRIVIQALKDKILSAGTYSNPAKVSGLLNTFGDHVRANFTLNEIMRLYDIAKTIPTDSIASLGLADPPNNFVTTDNINGISIVRPLAGIGNYSDIQNFVRNSLRDGFLAQEDAKVFVLNGTGIEGLATKKADVLKSYGYNVPYIGTAPTQTYANTILVDLTNGEKKYTKQYLENRLNLKAVSALPDMKIDATNADFVIILGQNEANGN